MNKPSFEDLRAEFVQLGKDVDSLLDRLVRELKPELHSQSRSVSIKFEELLQLANNDSSDSSKKKTQCLIDSFKHYIWINKRFDEIKNNWPPIVSLLDSYLAIDERIKIIATPQVKEISALFEMITKIIYELNQYMGSPNEGNFELPKLDDKFNFVNKIVQIINKRLNKILEIYQAYINLISRFVFFYLNTDSLSRFEVENNALRGFDAVKVIGTNCSDIFLHRTKSNHQ